MEKNSLQSSAYFLKPQPELAAGDNKVLLHQLKYIQDIYHLPNESTM